LRTLTLRVRRQNETALEVATFLAAHPAVAAVHYPGLATHPQHALAQRQMTGGFGGMMSFELRGLPAAQRFMDAMRLVSRAVSFGGFESLASHPAGMWFGSLGDSAAAEAGISPGLIRLAIGLEHPADLIADLARALGAAREAGPRG
jgi:cystathionine beta-lyase/cystathionine gamma-synthase